MLVFYALTVPLQVICNDTCSFTPANDAHDGTGVDPSLRPSPNHCLHAGGACQETPLESVLRVAPLLSWVAHTLYAACKATYLWITICFKITLETRMLEATLRAILKFHIYTRKPLFLRVTILPD